VPGTSSRDSAITAGATAIGGKPPAQ